MTIRRYGGALLNRGQALVNRVVQTKKYRPSRGHSRQDHLRAAADWLARAQDHGTDRGISSGAHFGDGFSPSYPETTGYIIPTFLSLADRFAEPQWRQRAIEAGHWECEVQMPEGAVMGCTIAHKPSPAVFNTGMVLLGWAALIRETGEERFRASAERACAWLLRMQDPDGCWRRGNSEFCNPSTTLYNVKAAWGLAEAGQILNLPAATDAAVRNASYTLTQQLPSGWFNNCCLSDATRPLLHTLAYTMQGLLGIARLTHRQEFARAAACCADALLKHLRQDGFLAGRWDSRMCPAVDWCCLTGSAQTGLVWARLYEITGRSEYREAVQSVSRYLVAHHDIENEDPSIRGGIPGSWPVHAEYGRFYIQNWATNYFVELLLAEERIANCRNSLR